MTDRHDDVTYLRMFEKWPCNTFKPDSHIVARHDEMHLLGKDVCEGYYAIVRPRRGGGGEWVVALSDGAKWTYSTTKAMLVDWRIARTYGEYCASAKAARPGHERPHG